MLRHLYLLTRKDKPDWDENRGFVVRARSAQRARALAQEQASGEARFGGEPARPFWTETSLVSCRKIGEATPGTRQTEEVVLRDFKAG